MKNVALQIVLIIILEKSGFINIILYQLKMLTFRKVIMHITPVVNQNKSEYYYNIFSEQGSYKDKFDMQYV